MELKQVNNSSVLPRIRTHENILTEAEILSIKQPVSEHEILPFEFEELEADVLAP